MKRANEFHKGMLRSDSRWRIEDTAKELGYSLASMSEYLTLAEWMKTYPKIESIRTLSEALDFVRAKKKELRLL